MTAYNTLCNPLFGIISKCIKNKEYSSLIWNKLNASQSEYIIPCIDRYDIFKHYTIKKTKTTHNNGPFNLHTPYTSQNKTTVDNVHISLKSLFCQSFSVPAELINLQSPPYSIPNHIVYYCMFLL